MKKIASIIIWSCLVVFIYSCKEKDNGSLYTPKELTGQTMGTYYRIVYWGKRDYQDEIEDLLQEINLAVSTYIDTSVISAFNQSVSGIDLNQYPTSIKFHFVNNLSLSKKVHRISMGYFDPTVMPLVNYWGFGYQKKNSEDLIVDSILVDSLQHLVGFDQMISIDNSYFAGKANPGVELDFSGIAKGYAIDEVARLLQRNGITDYLIDIGQENKAQGLNPDGKVWRTGISTPHPEASFTDIQAVIPLKDESIASSGNYRNFYEINDKRYVHTINPFTGYTENTRLLQASILSPNCAEADAFATGCMSMGFERCKEMLKQNPELKGLLIYDQGGAYQQYRTPNLEVIE